MPDRQLPPALCALSALAAASLVLWPADASLAAAPQPAVEPERLDQVVVSASLRQQLERDAPATVTVITRRDIQGRPETDVASLLKSVGGVAVAAALFRTGSASALAFGLALVMVFLILAALYERWRLPWAVLLAVPFAIAGALVFVLGITLGSV